MSVSKKALIASLVIGATACLWFFPAIRAAADDDERIPPVTAPVVIKECGACHMVYQPAFLPARSWNKMMKGLKDHFGENAELDEAKIKQITTYLTANAGDRRNGYRMRRLGAKETPLRISEMSWFKREHRRGRVSPATLKRRGAASVSDCVACHRGAARGYFDDD
jgi:mono/diheme cytochrome c family protein